MYKEDGEMNRALKVATFNFHMSRNYGEVMIAYALNIYLKILGIDSLTIDYYPGYHKAMYLQPHREF